MRFGRLTALRWCKKSGRSAWVVRCDCGAEKTVWTCGLRTGAVISCTCLRKERFHNRTHGLSGTTCYRHWQAMKERCHRPTHKDYPNYGAKGIRVCKRWRGKNGFVNFLEDMGPKPEGMSIDRINYRGHYSPKNCQWATNVQQAKNRKTTRWITYLGRTQTMLDWSRETGVHVATVHWRLKKGYPLDKVFERTDRITARSV